MKTAGRIGVVGVAGAAPKAQPLRLVRESRHSAVAATILDPSNECMVPLEATPLIGRPPIQRATAISDPAECCSALGADGPIGLQKNRFRMAPAGPSVSALTRAPVYFRPPGAQPPVRSGLLPVPHLPL